MDNPNKFGGSNPSGPTTGGGETTSTSYTEKDIWFDTLSSIKSLATLYHTFSTECSNDMLFDVVEDLREEVADEQRECFNIGYDHGWYPLEEESRSKVNKEVQKYNKSKSELTGTYRYNQE